MATATPRGAKSAKPAATATGDPPIKVRVRATQDGFYDNKLRRVGDVFVVEGRPGDHADQDDPKLPHLFSHKWMEVVASKTPERQSSSSDVLRQQHDEELAARLAEKAGGVGDDAPQATGDDDLI